MEPKKKKQMVNVTVRFNLLVIHVVNVMQSILVNTVMHALMGTTCMRKCVMKANVSFLAH